MKVAIIDYESGNLKSVAGIFKTAAKNYNINSEILITRDINYIANCDKVILPGVGTYKSCYEKFSAIYDMKQVINYIVNIKKIPFLGICVGMQLLASLGLEEIKMNGFNWIKGLIIRIDNNFNLRIPHIGWNHLILKQKHKLFSNISLVNNYRSLVYFTHSYKFITFNNQNILATTRYGNEIIVAVINENIIGVQFHPEKSHNFGVIFAKNFLLWNTNIV